MYTTSIILAGGRGTRLGELTNNTPKPLLNVAGRPFIFYILDYLADQGIEEIILATGYLAPQFERIIGDKYKTISIKYSVEEVPLGTGGALVQAMKMTSQDNIFVVNGDTLFKADLKELKKVYEETTSLLSIVVRHVDDAARYGKIDFQEKKITQIHEKRTSGPGYVNGGVYLINRGVLNLFKKQKCSFELEILPIAIKNQQTSYVISTNYFIDIGIPQDFERAQKELAN